jgi:hypothetical protein
MHTRRDRLFRHILAVAIAIAVASAPADAQDLGEGSQSYVNDFSRPGQATILVNVWGSAGQPGLWRVEKDVDLVDFLSVVGVPGIGTEDPGTRSTAYIAIYRTINGQRQEAYRRKVADILEDGATYPTLQSGDVVSVEVKRRRKIGLRTISSLVGTASSITLLILRFTDAN